MQQKIEELIKAIQRTTEAFKRNAEAWDTLTETLKEMRSDATTVYTH
jgi:uncharacterized coiled-coil protein SlyX